MAASYYKKNFAKAKDKKISLILQIALSLGTGRLPLDPRKS
jgi:hypothetical protein